MPEADPSVSVSVSSPTRRRRPSRGTVLRAAALLLAWVAFTLLTAGWLFTHSSREITVASHDAVVRPDFSGWATVRTGPVLPDVRIPTGSVVGVEVVLGKTNAPSTSELLQRYSAIATQPGGPQARVTDAVVGLAVDALVRGAAVGAVPVLVWLLVGAERRRALLASARTRRGALVVGVVLVVGVAAWSPWRPGTSSGDGIITSTLAWVPLATFVGPDVPVPDDAEGVEVLGDSVTTETKQLIQDAVASFDANTSFYDDAVADAADLDLHEPTEGQTVVVMVSDRHDNVSMDVVARAVGDAGGARAVYDLGDDTSVGGAWEAFSLDSVSEAFDGYDRWGVAGNHDSGTFVQDYLADQGWTMLDGEVVDGPDGPLYGVPDPRSSGLGPSRAAVGASFDEVRTDLADAVCAAEADGERVPTLVVHDANLGNEALERGCVDLVVGGHVHVESGPIEVDGPDGEIGYTYTMGTTGGAAYAFALGNKIRRPAGISLLTYEAGRPVGVQGVTFQTNGRFDVGDYTPLTY